MIPAPEGPVLPILLALSGKGTIIHHKLRDPAMILESPHLKHLHILLSFQQTHISTLPIGLHFHWYQLVQFTCQGFFLGLKMI